MRFFFCLIFQFYNISLLATGDVYATYSFIKIAIL